MVSGKRVYEPPERPDKAKPLVFTVGHSTRRLEVFIDLLRKYGVTRLLDVRTVPRSRFNPQFNGDTLPGTLRAAGIAYDHLPGLGGLRHPRADSANLAWRSASFRGFADYMQTPEFAAALELVMELARREQVAVMCAEAVPWRCHRSLIADALTVHGVPVEHILSTIRRQVHTLTPWACVEGDSLTYPSRLDLQEEAAGARQHTPAAGESPSDCGARVGVRLTLPSRHVLHPRIPPTGRKVQAKSGVLQSEPQSSRRLVGANGRGKPKSARRHAE